MSKQQFNDGQELVFEDFNTLQSRQQKELYDRLAYELIQRTENSFFSDSLQVGYISSTSVSVNAGLGFGTNASPDANSPEKEPIYKAANATVNLTAPDGVNDRIDLIVCKAALVDGDVESRKFKNASTSVITNESLTISKEWDAEIIAVDGTPAGSPVAPAVPAGYIQLAELLVSAVTGLSGSGAVTDSRNTMPLGGSATINTLAFLRLTQSAGLTIQQAMSEVDALLKNGTMDDNIFVDSVTDPAAPGTAGDLKVYNKGGTMFTRDNGGTVSPLGSGGGGGGGAQWHGDADSPIESTENGEKVWEFDTTHAQKLYLFLRVPSSYLAGRQLSMYVGAYSESTSNEWNLQAVSTLVRQNLDAIDSVANQETNDSGDLTNTVANQLRMMEVNLSTATGQINGFSVSPGDLVKVELTRQAPGGTEDSADIKFIPGSTEVKFG